MADKLSASQLKQLERAQERWLTLRDGYPRCWHCCACQTGPVEVRGTHRVGDAAPEEKELGCLKTVILGTDFPTNPQVKFICDEPTIELPDQRMKALRLSIWGKVFDPLIQTSICPSSLRLFTEATRLPSEDSLPWFGRLNFSERWNWPPTELPERHLLADVDPAFEPSFNFELPVEFEELANDSIAASGTPRTRPDLRLKALDRWLATVYDLLAVVPSEAKSHSVWIGLLRGSGGVICDTDWFVVGNKRFFMPTNEELDLTAKVPLAERHLPADICTASAMAIDVVLEVSSNVKTTPRANVELKNTEEDLSPLQQLDETPIPTDYQYDGEWLTAGTCKERFGLDDSRLSTWARNGCDYLNGRQLRRETFPPDQKSYCYHRVDIEQISSARDEKRHENSCGG